MRPLDRTGAASPLEQPAPTGPAGGAETAAEEWDGSEGQDEPILVEVARLPYRSMNLENLADAGTTVSTHGAATRAVQGDGIARGRSRSRSTTDGRPDSLELAQVQQAMAITAELGATPNSMDGIWIIEERWRVEVKDGVTVLPDGRQICLSLQLGPGGRGGEVTMCGEGRQLDRGIASPSLRYVEFSGGLWARPEVFEVSQADSVALAADLARLAGPDAEAAGLPCPRAATDDPELLFEVTLLGQSVGFASYGVGPWEGRCQSCWDISASATGTLAHVVLQCNRCRVPLVVLAPTLTGGFSDVCACSREVSVEVIQSAPRRSIVQIDNARADGGRSHTLRISGR